MSLTKTQRDWAQAQLGKPRAAVLDGTVTDVTPQGGGQYDLTIAAEGGDAKHRIKASEVQAGKHRGIKSSVLVDGTVSEVVYDEENDRVGLVIAAPNGRATQWHVPAISDDEQAALDTASLANKDQVEAEAREREVAMLKERLLQLLATDEDVLAALHAALGSS